MIFKVGDRVITNCRGEVAEYKLEAEIVKEINDEIYRLLFDDGHKKDYNKCYLILKTKKQPMKEEDLIL